MRVSMSAQASARVWPVAVRKIFLPSCSNSGWPTVSESCLTCNDSVGGERCSSSAARAKLLWRATARKMRSWCSVAWRRFIRVSLVDR
ncbi:hypothetical protein FQZ97_1123240 [compost metagenome]